MNKRSLTGLFILVWLCCSFSISYACNLPPDAYISDCPKYTAIDNHVGFDGYSTDHDGYIVDWRWTFPPQAYDVNYVDPWEVWCKFNEPGIYTVNLEVEDNDGATDDFNCTVYVIKVDLNAECGYIAVNTDDDNTNSTQDKDEYGTVDNENDLVEISLSITPSMNHGYIKLVVPPQGLLSVWEEPTKGTSVIDPTDNPPTMEAIWDLSEESFPETLWVEAYAVNNDWPLSSVGIFYLLHPIMGPTVDSNGVTFNPVWVRLFMDGVIEDNEEFPGNYILYNKDDDDDDGVPDYDDGYNKDGEDGNEDDENIYEDDLVQILPHWVEPTDYMTGTVTFDVTSGDSKVKVWKAHPFYPAVKEIKDIEISLPETYNTPADMPKVFYVEGIEPSGGPRDVEFTLTYTKEGLTFKDKIKVTVVHVELYRDADYTQLLDDWPKPPSGDLLRSPKYIFGEDDPIYVQVKNIGTDPDLAEPITAAVAVKSQSSDYIYLDLKETGVNTEIFRNSEAAGELLYLSTSSSEGNGDKKIKVIDEEVLYFWLLMPSYWSTYKWSEHVMVDRAEVGVEWQSDYDTYDPESGPPPPYIDTINCADDFSKGVYNNLGTANLVWFKNFDNGDLNSKESHWDSGGDAMYADSVDMAVWCGHGPVDAVGPYMRFFVDLVGGVKQPPDKLYWSEIDWGDKDADWVVLNTCSFLNGTDTELKQMVSSSRGVHLICGYKTDMMVYCAAGSYFSDRLDEGMSIRISWHKQCWKYQPSNNTSRVFGATACMSDTIGESGPIQTSRDPNSSSTYSHSDYTQP